MSKRLIRNRVHRVWGNELSEATCCLVEQSGIRATCLTTRASDEQRTMEVMTEESSEAVGVEVSNGVECLIELFCTIHNFFI